MATQATSAAAMVARLEARARAALSPAELAFSIANDSFGLLNFRQAFVLAGSGAQARLQALSGLALPSEDSPYLIWLRRNWPWMQQRLADQAGWLPSPAASDAGAPAPDDIPEEVRDGWLEWWPLGLQALPLRRRDGVILAWVGFLLEQPPTPVQMQALAHLAVHWGYCWEMLGGKPRRSLRQRWQALGRKRHAVWLAAALLCLVPIRQSALAPAEIVALDATTVSAPLDGVVKTLHVRPNQAVQAGDLLLSLDDTTLRNRLEVATQSLAVAEAEWMSASQKAFDNLQSKGEITLLQGRVQEKRAELAAVQSQLARTEVTAPHAGLSIYSSPDDWIGRPVTTGERILQVANPDSAGVLIHLPVADALVLDAQAKVRLFLTVKPLSPLDATVTETSYQATLSPDGVASYRLRATLDPDQKLSDARIGLHGTAKITGDLVPLLYYVLRRPLAALRERSGW